MLKYVCFKEEMSSEYFFYGGTLFVNLALPVKRMLEIIGEYLDVE